MEHYLIYYLYRTINCHIMKAFTTLVFSIIILISFTNCSSAQKLQKAAPIVFDEVYCQSWVAGVQGGGSGINLFISTPSELPNTIQLDSVYFRGKVAKMQRQAGGKIIYVAYFRTEFNQKTDIIMSGNAQEEYGNALPKKTTKIPFKLKENECVISYKNGSKTQYYKIENIVEIQPEHYPSARPDKQ